jgi:hypothetical protein
MGFWSLQHSRVRRSTSRGRCRRPLRSAFRVWLPSGRFTPSEPVPVLFRTGGALGIHPSELSPPGRYRARFRAEAPTYRSTRRCSRRRSDGPAQRAAVSGLLPFRESLAAKREFSAVAAGCSLGFCPSRVCRRKPRSGLHPNSSRALRELRSCDRDSPAPRSLYQPSLGPTRTVRRGGRRNGQPF